MLLYGTGTSAIAVHGLKYCYQLQVRFCFSATTCLFFSFFVNQISREPLNAFVPSWQGSRVWSLAWTSLNVKGQGHQRQKMCYALPLPPAVTEWNALAADIVTHQQMGPFRQCRGVISETCMRSMFG